jgi:hypothetical protein
MTSHAASSIVDERRIMNEDDLWPEDVLTEAEWESGWFDRKLIAGEIQEWERAIVPREFGGDA